MRFLLLAIGLVALPAQAQLYRWVDPDSGSVKFSSYPPPWFREEGQVGPAVEVIQRRAPAKPDPARPGAKPATASVAPGTPAAAVAAASLEARRKELMQMLAGLPATDFNRAGSEFQRHLEAYRALRAELDRIDPAGRQRRSSEEDGAFETLLRGIGAQTNAKPPAPE